jgi:hypothetical protein
MDDIVEYSRTHGSSAKTEFEDVAVIGLGYIGLPPLHLSPAAALMLPALT